MTKALNILKQFSNKHESAYGFNNIIVASLGDINNAIAELELESTKSCEWKRSKIGDELYDDPLSLFDTGCKNSFEFTFDGVKDNGFKFCPYCGGSINENHELLA